ncbi:MAG: His-Xaa-Ser system radical SAM maturase HxsB [Hyphomonadaceae bacterium]
MPGGSDAPFHPFSSTSLSYLLRGRQMIRSHYIERSSVSVVTNELGEFAFVTPDLDISNVGITHPRYRDLEARGFLQHAGPTGGLAAIVRRTRKAFVKEGPSLHIFVVSLRCDHSCQYCQVSRASLTATGKDMTLEHALMAVERVFESDAPTLTIEFQGGEPALRFDLIRKIVEASNARAARDCRSVRFTMATTLHLLSQEDLQFCKEHGIHLSTSLDGPEDVHTLQRALPTRDSWKRTIEGLARARAIVGQSGVAALPTITRAMLSRPEELVSTYLAFGFNSIFLRPLAPYGFAKKTQKQLGYTVPEFMAFYERALAEILRLNVEGREIQETTAAILLRHILTPFHSGYMDLRSPAGAGLGVVVYNYDGGVFPSDEARMAAESGDRRFRLGHVSEPLEALLVSPAMRWLAKGAVAEQLTDCAKCAFVPYCGADPVHHAIVHGDPAAPRAGTDFCDRNTALFRLLFGMLADRDPETTRTFTSWAMGIPRSEAEPGWIEQ